MEINKDDFIQEFYPIRCYTCGELVAALVDDLKNESIKKYNRYKKNDLSEDDKEKIWSECVKETLDSMGINLICTRQSLMSPIRIAFNNVESKLNEKLKLTKYKKSNDVYKSNKKIVNVKLKTVNLNVNKTKNIIKKEEIKPKIREDRIIKRASVVGIPVVNNETPIITYNKGFNANYKLAEITYYCG